MGAWAAIPVFFGCAAVLLGLVLLIRGRWRDSGKGTVRCPRCWYPMHQVGGLICPECGHVAPGERALRRTRRRWRVRALGLVILLLSSALFLTPRMVEHGPAAALPTLGLLLLEPYFHEDPYYYPHEPSLRFGAVTTSAIAKELQRRNAASTISPWMWRLYLRRAELVRTRPAWPRGVRLIYQQRHPSWITADWSTQTNAFFQLYILSSSAPGATTTKVPDARPPLNAFTLDAPDEMGRAWFTATILKFNAREMPNDRKPPIASERTPIRVLLADSAEECIRADPDPAATQTLRDECRALLFFKPETYAAHPDPRFILKTQGLGLPPHLAYGLAIEIRRDGEPVMTGYMPGVTSRVQFPSDVQVHLARWIAQDHEMDPTLSRWDARIMGDAGASLYQIEKSAYWSGEFIVPIRLQR